MKLIDIANEIVHETLISESYRILTEIVNPDNHYDFEKRNRNLWIFKDKIDVEHFIVIHKNLIDLDKNIAEVKFGWKDPKTDKPRYDIPTSYDERIYNTHIYIFLNEILPNFLQYFNSIQLNPTDIRRYRLYRMSLNKYLDSTKYILSDLSDSLEIKTKN